MSLLLEKGISEEQLRDRRRFDMRLSEHMRQLHGTKAVTGTFGPMNDSRIVHWWRLNEGFRDHNLRHYAPSLKPLHPDRSAYAWFVFQIELGKNTQSTYKAIGLPFTVVIASTSKDLLKSNLDGRFRSLRVKRAGSI